MMSRSTKREYSSTDISSVNGYKVTVRASKVSEADQILLAYCPNENKSKKCESQKDSISEVTINNTIYSGKSTPRRRVITCKDTNDEEMITYHLKLKPESLRYTFSTTDPKETLNAEKNSDYQGTSGLDCYSNKKELPSHDRRFSQNCQNEKSGEKSHEEKTTNCRPVINLHTVEFVERTIDKNNRLKRLVRDIVGAREKEKQLEAWNNYINELKNKYAYNYYIPEKYHLECDNNYNVPCQCTSTRPCSDVYDDYCDESKQSDYIMNSYRNEISCYPISSEAWRSKNKANEPPRRQFVKTEYIINAEEENPRKRKRRQLSKNQVRCISAQTSSRIGTSSNDTDSKSQTRSGTRDEIEGYEPCVCAAEKVRDSGTNTEKVEQETVTDLKKHATTQACYCNQDQGTTVTEDEIPTYTADSIETKHHELERTATYKTVSEKMTKLKEELGQSQTCDNSLGIIEEKLDNIISTMNDLLAEVKLRITDMSTEKFDTATSTLFPHINDKHENCVAHKLLEQEIKLTKDNAKQNEGYNFDLFKRDTGTKNTAHLNTNTTPTKNMAQLNDIPTSTKTTYQLNAISAPIKNNNQINIIPVNKTDATAINPEDQTALTHAENNKEAEVSEKLEKKSSKLVADPTVSLIRNGGKNHLVSNFGKSVDKPQPVEDPQRITSLQHQDDQLANVEQSVIDLKKASKSFMDTLDRSRPSLTEDEINKRRKKSLGQRLQEKFSSKAEHANQSHELKQSVRSKTEEDKDAEENSDSNKKQNSKRQTKNQEFCCVYADLRSMPRPRYRHASVTASLDTELSNAAEIILDVYYSNNDGNDLTMSKSRCEFVDRAVSKIDENIMNNNGKSNNTKLRIAVDRAVSKIEEHFFGENQQKNYISVDRAVSKIDDILIEEINKSNQAKKDINEMLNKKFTNNYGVQIAFELPTKERGTEVTDSLPKTKVSSTSSSSQGKKYYGGLSRRTPLTIAAVNTDPMSLLGLFRLSTNTMRQLLTCINFDYSSYLPSVSQALPTVSGAVRYLCHVCGAAFRRPSELSDHMKSHNLDSAKDCCVCRHMLPLRQRTPGAGAGAGAGVFTCRFCALSFTRAYCCELHERACSGRRGRRLDVSDSRSILT